jgi:hypothetical protein
LPDRHGPLVVIRLSELKLPLTALPVKRDAHLMRLLKRRQDRQFSAASLLMRFVSWLRMR